jgi:hypothetical protein
LSRSCGALNIHLHQYARNPRLFRGFSTIHIIDNHILFSIPIYRYRHLIFLTPPSPPRLLLLALSLLFKILALVLNSSLNLPLSRILPFPTNQLDLRFTFAKIGRSASSQLPVRKSMALNRPARSNSLCISLKSASLCVLVRLKTWGCGWGRCDNCSWKAGRRWASPC